ncbi:ABC transporter substrate-binding protein [Trichlorobacter ammonificans]|uniref:ABC transporter substrate-binding protein n=1 Tax=Trichlorobacter ammonificans TaxID=2916410 RepID=A0ABM9D611_9BACT|nr:ABC transporter substrate binding protein [Trichlorobacter ammonificans]CAH2030162.1 conserved exported protein of unknown function [Trichlorobacter ammonificans]
MRRSLLLILALLLLCPTLARAYDLLVLQSQRNPAYDEVLKGLNSDRSISQRLVVLSDYADVDVVRIVREDSPVAIVAIGDAALTAARKVRHIPVIALMSLKVHSLKSSQPNLAGIGMFVAPESYCDLFRRMQVKRVGVVYSPAQSGWYLQSARQAARDAGITLVTREVAAPRETLAQLSSLAGKVDALWMLPDLTAVTRETAEAYFHFSQQQMVPVVSFAAGYLGLGAAAALEMDRFALGVQAKEMVEAFLAGAAERSLISFPKNVALRTNPTVLKHLGYQTP